MYQAERIQRRSQQLSPIGEHNGFEPPFIYLFESNSNMSSLSISEFDNEWVNIKEIKKIGCLFRLDFDKQKLFFKCSGRSELKCLSL